MDLAGMCHLARSTGSPREMPPSLFDVLQVPQGRVYERVRQGVIAAITMDGMFCAASY